MSVKTDTPAECTLQKQACGVGSTHRAPGKRFGGTREHAIATPGMLVPQLWAWSLLLLSAFHLSSAMQANADNKSMLCMWPVGSKYWREACKMLRLFSPFKFFFFFYLGTAARTRLGPVCALRYVPFKNFSSSPEGTPVLLLLGACSGSSFLSINCKVTPTPWEPRRRDRTGQDRKSTRLNSSHL